jgi:Ca2+-binding RTX toxin-like protein
MKTNATAMTTSGTSARATVAGDVSPLVEAAATVKSMGTLSPVDPCLAPLQATRPRRPEVDRPRCRERDDIRTRSRTDPVGPRRARRGAAIGESGNPGAVRSYRRSSSLLQSYGGTDADNVWGGGEDDVILRGAGNDTLRAGGRHELNGWTSDDLLKADLNDHGNRVNGGPGDDVCQIHRGDVVVCCETVVIRP